MPEPTPGRPLITAQIDGGAAAPPPETPASDGERRFTQADVDRMIKARATRVAAEQYGDYDDLKTKAARLEELEAANASEVDKAVRKAQQDTRSEVLATANARILNAEARSIAAELRFRNPSLAVKGISLDGIKVAEDGTVDADAVRSLLDDLRKTEPYLVHDDQPAPPGTGSGDGKPRPDGAQGQNPGRPGGRDAGVAEARRRFGDKNKTTSST